MTGFPDLGTAAACTRADPELFFPGQRDVWWKLPAAKAVCATCPVRDHCLDYALTHDVIGVWGGLSYAERHRIRKQHGIKADPTGIRRPDSAMHEDVMRLRRSHPNATAAELGELLGISRDAVQKHLDRARQGAAA